MTLQRRGLDPFLGGGSIAHCDSEGSCKKVFSKGLTYPNGLVLGADGLIYVPSAITGEIKIFSLQQDNTLEEKALSIKVPYPVDNLSVDSKGNIWAAGFPSAQTWMKATKNPHGIHPPTSAWRIRKLPGDYELVKVLEDDGSTLPGATIVVHDAKIGRLFFGGE
jgi:arylesterase/paraoxonase